MLPLGLGLALGLALDFALSGAGADGRIATALCAPRRRRAVQLHKLRIVHVGAERARDGLQVCLVAVRGQLRSVRQPIR